MRHGLTDFPGPRDSGASDAYPGEESPSDTTEAVPELELERIRKRLAVWNVFQRHMTDDTQTWRDVAHALTEEDREEIVRICGDTPLRDLFLHFE